jgi:EmrB/QacA subfamily drug resistance transporter
MSAPRTPARRGSVLAIALLGQSMIILDASVTVAALPRLRDALNLSPAGLSWVQNTYTLAFGGLLLLGARSGDILGRRRVFAGAIGLFTAASLLAGLATSAEWLLIARAAQGFAAAFAAPATLALLMQAFPEGPQLARAISLYSGVTGAGAAAGLVLGGVLTDALSWRWAFFVNVPLGTALAVLAPLRLPRSERHAGRFDVAGALTSTLGLGAIVFALVHAATQGWGDAPTVATLAAGVALLAGFVAIERRAEQPITPLWLFASRERSSAYVSRLLLIGAMFGSFFFLTQFAQGVLGFSAFEAGVAFVPLSLVQFAMSLVSRRLTPRFGARPVLAAGLAVAVAGMALLSRLSASTQYFPGIVVPLVLLGAGTGVSFPPLTSAGIAGSAGRAAGAASGLVNVAHQLGGTLGIAILVTVLGSGDPRSSQAIGTTLSAGTVLIALALVVVLAVLRTPAPAPAAHADSVAEPSFSKADR